MNGNNKVKSILNNLGGVYRDPIRVSSDARNLVNNQVGRHLRPNVASLMENTGTYHSRLFVFQGTVAMTFRGSNYNIPVDIFLPPSYPVRPPVCYVRPVSTMIIKENHRHVGSDGMVYAPYLHEWSSSSHNLIQMVKQLSEIFGNDPPVFAKPANYNQQTASSIQQTQRPPGYNDVQSAIEASTLEASRMEQERREKMEIEKAMEQFNLQEAKLQSEKEENLRRSTVATREKLIKKLQLHLKNMYEEEKPKIREDLKHQKNLDQGKITCDQQLKELVDMKVKLEESLNIVNSHNSELEEWIKTSKEAQEKQKLVKEQDVDTIVMPVDPISEQMLELSCENAAITDCLYYLDKALVKGKIPLDLHLKKVRALAKKQFLARAHLMKICKYNGGMNMDISH